MKIKKNPDIEPGFLVIFSPVILLQFTTTLFFIFQIDLKLHCVIQQKMENINMFKLNI